MSNTADAIIIGGGIHGASLAFHLGQRGLKAIVLEKETLAAGATGRSSGVVRMHYDFEPESRLAWESFHYFRNWADMVGGESGFTRTGFLQIISPEYEDALRGNVAMHQRIGIPSLLITADDVRRLAPHFKTNDFNIAAYEPESGYADPSAAAASLMDAAKQHGARLEQGVTVTGIQLASGKVIGVS
ncbi:MAG: FAD-binding oxidoreductase, partial [Anaerolineae bacterium]|nr:FAD-binding oxidoreductase [Anaerolineae bacterium]